MNHLFTFYNNVGERETVKNFLIDTLKLITVEKAFAGESVSGIKEANEAVEKAFDRLEEIYGKIEEKEISNSR